MLPRARLPGTGLHHHLNRPRQDRGGGRARSSYRLRAGPLRLEPLERDANLPHRLLELGEAASRAPRPSLRAPCGRSGARGRRSPGRRESASGAKRGRRADAAPRWTWPRSTSGRIASRTVVRRMPVARASFVRVTGWRAPTTGEEAVLLGFDSPGPEGAVRELDAYREARPSSSTIAPRRIRCCAHRPTLTEFSLRAPRSPSAASPARA